jgi:hypothetical protein
MIIRFNYLYRDGGNYKRWNSVDFCNPDQLRIEEIDKQLRGCFDQECYFIAHQAGIPEVFLYADEPISDDDHCFHEYDCVVEVEPTNSAIPARTITEFLKSVQACASEGWKAFDPLDHLSRIQDHSS